MADERITSINLGSQHVSGALFRKLPGGGLALDQYERTELLGDPGGDEQQAAQSKMALTEIVGVLKAKNSAPRIVISGQQVFVRFVKLPPLDVEQVDQIVEFEAQQQVPYPINEVVWDYQLMGVPDDPEVEVLLAAIKSDELDDIDEIVTGAGLKSCGVDIAPIALFNAFRFNYHDLTGTTLLIDIGARTTNLIFVENSKVFIRTIKIGGTDITRAIAKEFNVSFQDAEERKIADGFVALGGPYADHDDPVIAGVSKVIRNSLTRLHSEIMRTTNFYRSQQAGSAPSLALLSGATVALPFMREFFAEKLNIPIDYFNALRNVSIGGKVDSEFISSQAHSLGEIVGSALASSGKAPLQLELAPETIRKDREFQKRKPFLIASTVVLAALLGAIGYWFSKAGAIAATKAEGLQSQYDELEKHSKALKSLKSELAAIETKKEPYVKAAFERSYWTGLLNDFSNRTETDLMWITVMEPLDAQGNAVIPSADLPADPGKVETVFIEKIRIKGLYREDPDVVNRYYDALRDSPYLDIKNIAREDVIITLQTNAPGQYAWDWEMVLTLPENVRISFTKS